MGLPFRPCPPGSGAETGLVQQRIDETRGHHPTAELLRVAPGLCALTLTLLNSEPAMKHLYFMVCLPLFEEAVRLDQPYSLVFALHVASEPVSESRVTVGRVAGWTTIESLGSSQAIDRILCARLPGHGFCVRRKGRGAERRFEVTDGHPWFGQFVGATLEIRLGSGSARVRWRLIPPSQISAPHIAGVLLRVAPALPIAVLAGSAADALAAIRWVYPCVVVWLVCLYPEVALLLTAGGFRGTRRRQAEFSSRLVAAIDVLLTIAERIDKNGQAGQLSMPSGASHGGLALAEGKPTTAKPTQTRADSLSWVRPHFP